MLISSFIFNLILRFFLFFVFLFFLSSELTFCCSSYRSGSGHSSQNKVCRALNF